MAEWPCRCVECAPLIRCAVCGAPGGVICDVDCSEHPQSRSPCPVRTSMTDGEWLAGLVYSHYLGRNLAVAGALCMAHEQGMTSESDFRWGHLGWMPGCGRPSRMES